MSHIKKILSDKKILFFAPSFFDYEKEIKIKLESYGAKVDFFDERPSNSFLTKVLLRTKKKLLSRTVNRYYKRIINKTKHIQYDFVLFISPETITYDLFLQLKKIQRDSKYILYLWDSLKNKNAIEVLGCFDKKFSFDKEDCSQASLNLEYRPLFYLDIYKKFLKTQSKKTIDLLFIGSIHGDRFKLLIDIKKKCQKQNVNVFFYLFFPSKRLYYFRRIFNKSLRGTKACDFKFKSLTNNEVINYINKSKVILDIQSKNQIGLTMRSIEMLGANKKMITTNCDIVNYDFYNSENIHVIDREGINISNSFFSGNFVEINNEIYNRYSIDKWIYDLFS